MRKNEFLELKDKIEKELKVNIKTLYEGFNEQDVYGVVHIKGRNFVISKENGDFLYKEPDEEKEFELKNTEECYSYIETSADILTRIHPIKGVTNFLIKNTPVVRYFENEEGVHRDFGEAEIVDYDEDGDYRVLITTVYIAKLEKGKMYCIDGTLYKKVD